MGMGRSTLMGTFGRKMVRGRSTLIGHFVGVNGVRPVDIVWVVEMVWGRLMGILFGEKNHIDEKFLW